MSYQVLYRRFRPTRFCEISGQEEIVSILKNQIISKKLSHSYLFSGSKGTGKTTTAKIFARTVNCEHPKDGEACNECEYCKSVSENNISDIVEIDAASNRGIDEIRELKEKVGYLPSVGRYRVYIIDEVHMLTTEAFNALLTTLEEPPEHIIFIFATTEQHKILPTILSRCQRFDFKRIDLDTIVNRLEFVMNEIGVEFELDALKMVASCADGALRDALSILDKSLTEAKNNLLTTENVYHTLGMTDENNVIQIAEAIIEADCGLAYEKLDEFISRGGDIINLNVQLLDYFRALMIYSSMSNPQRIINKSEFFLGSLSKMKNVVDIDVLVAFVKTFSLCKKDSRLALNPRYLLEANILYLTNQSKLYEASELSKRMESLEKQFSKLSTTQMRFVPVQRVEGIENEVDTETRYSPAMVDSQMSSAEIKTVEKKAPSEVQKPTGPVMRNDKQTVSMYQETITFVGKFLFNKDRDVITQTITDNLKVAYYSDDMLYVYPTGSAVHLMGAFYAGNGLEKVEAVLRDKVKKDIKLKVITKPTKEELANVVSSPSKAETRSVPREEAPVRLKSAEVKTTSQPKDIEPEIIGLDDDLDMDFMVKGAVDMSLDTEAVVSVKEENQNLAQNDIINLDDLEDIPIVQFNQEEVSDDGYYPEDDEYYNSFAQSEQFNDDDCDMSDLDSALSVLGDMTEIDI